jgi:hypothetical protein
MAKRHIHYFLTGLFLVVLISGCGSGRMQTKGRLLKNGAPYLPAQGEIIRVMFVPIPDGVHRVTDFHAAIFDPEDGTFYAAARDGQGIPPGKYRIAIEHLRNKADLFKGAFDAERSPFVREITSPGDEVVIDVAKPK